MSAPRCPTTEKELWQAIKKHLPDVHWTRIETGQTGRGVPDLEGCYQGVSAWIELKVVRAGKVRITPLQVKWHAARTMAGGLSWFVAADPAKSRLIIGDGGSAHIYANVCFAVEDGGAAWPLSEEKWGKLQRLLFSSSA